MDKSSTKDDFVTVGVYATRAGIARQTVLNRIYRGDLPARTDLGKWARIPRAEYDKLPPLENGTAS